MTQYVVEVEVDRRPPTGVELEQLVAAVAAWHGVAGSSLAGLLEVTLTLPAESLAQAVATGLAIVSAYGAPLVVGGQAESVRNAREGWATPAEQLSVTEVAGLLGVSRQAVLQRIEVGSLPAVRVGRSWAIPAGAVRPAGA